MIKTIFYIILIFKIILTSSFSEEKVMIILKINNDIVTNFDIETEKKYLKALTPSLSKANKKQMNDFAYDSIVREIIKKNEITRFFEIAKDTPYVNALVKDIYTNLNFKNEKDFLNYLREKNLTIDVIKRKLEIESAWNLLIYKKYKNQIEVDEKKFKKRLENDIKKADKQETYLLSEIVFTGNSREEYDEKFKIISESIKNIGFGDTARIYSIADTSKFGGEIGWIKSNQIAKTTYMKIKDLVDGEFSEPINTPGGLILIQIRERKLEEINIDFDLELKNIITLEKNRQLNSFSNIYFKKIKKQANINEN